MEATKYIHVGEIFVGQRPTQISTVLGSCIAVCLYDPVTEVGGMNHYLLPLWNDNGLQSPKYGNISIPKLIKNMQKYGSKLENIQAKVFGGANVINVDREEMMIGRKNILIAEEILKEYRIKIGAKDVGGVRGRRIYMQSNTGKIMLKYTQRT